MNIVFSLIMVLIGIGAGFLVTALIVPKERERANKERSILNNKIEEQKHIILSMNLDNTSLINEAIRLRNIAEKERNESYYYKQLNRALEAKQSRGNSVGVLDEDKTLISKALKKAMFDSHPDRGGNSDEFIEYNRVYKKYK